MRKRTAVLLLGAIMVGAIVVGTCNDTIASRYFPIPAKVSFASEWQRYGALDAALIRADLDSIARRPVPAPPKKGELVLPQPDREPVTIDGIGLDDLPALKASLTAQEERAEQARDDAIYAKEQRADLVLMGANTTFGLSLLVLVLVLLAAPFQRWRARWTARRRQRPSVSGVHIAEKVGRGWGSVERVFAPLREAFGRGRQQARKTDADCPKLPAIAESKLGSE